MEEGPRRTSLVPLAFPCFVLCLIGMQNILDYRGGRGSFPLYGGTFAPSYSVSKTLRFFLVILLVVKGKRAKSAYGLCRGGESKSFQKV